jgi:hypothetical protein
LRSIEFVAPDQLANLGCGRQMGEQTGQQASPAEN